MGQNDYLSPSLMRDREERSCLMGGWIICGQNVGVVPICDKDRPKIFIKVMACNCLSLIFTYNPQADIWSFLSSCFLSMMFILIILFLCSYSELGQVGLMAGLICHPKSGFGVWALLLLRDAGLSLGNFMWILKQYNHSLKNCQLNKNDQVLQRHSI